MEREAGGVEEDPANVRGRGPEPAGQDGEVGWAGDVAGQFRLGALHQVTPGGGERRHLPVTRPDCPAQYRGDQRDHRLLDGEWLEFLAFDREKEPSLAEVQLMACRSGLGAEGPFRFGRRVRVEFAGNGHRHLRGDGEPIAPVAIRRDGGAVVPPTAIVNGHDAGIGHDGTGAGLPDPDPAPWENDDVAFDGA